MDVLAHGLWGGALFGRLPRTRWKWAFLAGIAPDVVAFGPALISRLVTGDFAEWMQPGPPQSSWFPPYVFALYNVTHSLVVWAAIVCAIVLWRRALFPWVLGAWGLHVLCDIPLHTLQFFPTPYLWPLPTPLVNGIRWSTPTFMLINYAALAGTYLVLAVSQNHRVKKRG